RLRHITLSVSIPKDKQELGYPNEFRVASYSQVISEESRAEALAERVRPASFDSTPEPARRARAISTGLGGDVAGAVVDSQGAAVSGVRLTLTNIATGAVLTATTDDGGFYAFVGLLSGR